MVLQNTVKQPAQFEVAQKNRKHILFHIFRIFQIWKYLNIEFRKFKSYVKKSVWFQSGGFCRGRGVVFHRGGTVTNMATLSSFKRKSTIKLSAHSMLLSHLKLIWPKIYSRNMRFLLLLFSHDVLLKL